MPPFIIHTIVGSPYARAVLATLEEKAAPYTLQPIRPGAHRAPDHLARHPFGRVPVLQHGDFWLYETQAILRYLDRILPTPPLIPPTPQEAARMDQIMGINDCYLFRGAASTISFQRVVAPRIAGAMPDEAAIAVALPETRTLFAALSALLADQPFLAGPTLTLADLLTGPQMSLLAETPEWPALTAPHPNLVTWLARLHARPSFTRTSWDALEAALPP